MASVALANWNGARKTALAEIAAAHGALGGKGPGRRYATLQLNHAYTVLLSSQFQGFCRDLHSEAVDFLVAHTQPTTVAAVLRAVTTQGRKLDHGNPNPGNLGSDFARLGMSFWNDVGLVDRRKGQRLAALDSLNDWRNAIAHQDWSGVPNQNPALQLRQVNAWQAACAGLATSFDTAVGQHLAGMVGQPPW
ncbi:MAG TPA: hypothetical protein VJN18_03110 [Polyangiaceae bacterium]|nr:hypothetical protein [Polyangiaceae bacterium]